MLQCGSPLVDCFGNAPPMPMTKAMPMMAAMPPPPPMGAVLKKSAMRRSRGASPPERTLAIGQANAARVSRGSMVDKLDETVKVKMPTRDPTQHVTVTVVIYNTVAGGVPSVDDVKAAVEDMERLYASCGWTGNLADDSASFMKSELTVKDMMDIEDKIVSQPYVPPVGEIGLVQGGDVFPMSVAA